MQIKMDAALYRAVAAFQSKEEIRYYLCGVYVQEHPDGGAVLVATDGHRMLVARDASGICKRPAIVAIDAKAIARQTGADLKIEIDDSGAATCGDYKSPKSVFIDGTYPDWPHVCRPIVELAKKRFYGKPQFAPASFNSRLVASFRRVPDILDGGERAPSMQLISFSPHDPALVLYPDKPHVFGVLMPMRTGEVDPAVPAFMRSILEPKKKPAKKNTARKAA